MKKLLAILLSCYWLPVNASLITSNTTEITMTQQSYAQSIHLAGLEYTDVVLSLTAKGDYGLTTMTEHIEFFIDGTLLAHWEYSTPGISVVENVYEYDYTLSGDIVLSNALWQSFAADGVLDISWSNGFNVQAYPGDAGGADYVSYSLSGNLTAVPLPAALWLFSAGILGLITVARRNS